MTFYPVLGGAVFALSLLGAIILYSVTRKWYPVFYVLSIALYIYTVGYVIDVFDLQKDFIFLVLLVSAGVMLLVGWYLNKRLRQGRKPARVEGLEPPQSP